MTQNIVFRLNRKIKMSRNPPKIPLKSLKIMRLQSFLAIKQNVKHIQIYNFRRCTKQVFFLPHFLSSRRKSWTHFFTLLQVLSVRQKSSACKTVLKSHVNGLVSPQGMAFLDIEISFQKIFCGYVQTRIKPTIN